VALGHSRGGEGVVAHALLNKSLGSPYGIKAVLTLAPVNFGRKKLNGIALMNIAPYCDGDVSNISGVHFYDDVRYSDPLDDAPKHSALLIGANHNFFNTVWTPGLYIAGTSDDWSGSQDPNCGKSLGTSKRLTAAKQQAAFNAYASAFFRVYIGNETQFTPILEVDDIVPPTSSKITASDIFVSYHPPKSKRLDINKEDTEGSELTNTLGGAVSSTSLVKFDICSDDVSEINCSVGSSTQEPHSGSGSKLGLSQLGMSWDNPTDSYENIIPASNKNFSAYKDLQFRAAIDFSEYTATADLDFTVQLIDVTAKVSSKAVSGYTHALYAPPGKTSNKLPKVMFNTIKIPLKDFTGIDLTQIQKIKFLYDKSTTGSIYVVDLALSGSSGSVTSIESDSLNPYLSIHPNPTSDNVTIDFGMDYLIISKLSLYILNVVIGNNSRNYKIIKN
jgi:hypothetical protein